MDKPAVLLEEEGLLVLYKPSGIPTTPSGERNIPSLIEWAKQEYGQESYLHPSSRLDAEVSGLVTISRNAETTRSLMDARAQGKYIRRYVAIINGVRLSEEAGSWVWPIAIDSADKRRRVAEEVGTPRAKEAKTDYRLGAQRGKHSIIWLFPQTGRTHQLRVHTQKAGAPIVGDKHYGIGRNVVVDSGEVFSVSRAMLHCQSIRVEANSISLEIECPVPVDFARVWESLGGDTSAFSFE